MAFLLACTPQAKIKKLEGHSLTFMLNELGKPTRIKIVNTDSVYIYEIKKDLRSTEISKATITLDPMVSPEVLKNELYLFTIKNGMVVNTDHHIEYDRKKTTNPGQSHSTGIKINK